MKRIGFICSAHTHGLSPSSPRTFHPRCVKCRELLAQGKRTGNEPMPGQKQARKTWNKVIRGGYVEALKKREAAKS